MEKRRKTRRDKYEHGKLKATRERKKTYGFERSHNKVGEEEDDVAERNKIKAGDTGCQKQHGEPLIYPRDEHLSWCYFVPFSPSIERKVETTVNENKIKMNNWGIPAEKKKTEKNYKQS